jgi:hypothetical protein
MSRTEQIAYPRRVPAGLAGTADPLPTGRHVPKSAAAMGSHPRTIQAVDQSYWLSR